MNDYDLIKMHDDITTLHAALVDLTAAVNHIKNTEVVGLWNHVNNNTQELQRHAGEQENLSNTAHGNSVTIDDLRNDIDGVNRELQELTGVVHGLDHRVRFS